MRSPTMNSLVQQVLRVVTEPGSWEPNASLLLADLCACVRDGSRRSSTDGWLDDGVTGRAALLAMRSHASDRDDVHWAGPLHPGSVVWPVVLAVGDRQGVAPDRLLHAAAAGYEAMGAVADLLGGSHAAKWHVTATAGHAGAAAAAAWLLTEDADVIGPAMGLALAVCGGVGQTVQERVSASGFHRAAAAVSGIAAARAAATGLQPPVWVLEGDRGVVPLLGGEIPATSPANRGRPFMATTSVRLFPVNGLAQSAVQAAVALARSVSRRPRALEVLVAPGVAEATRVGGPGGAWWDLRAAVCSAFLSRDEWAVDDRAVLATAAGRELYERSLITPSELSPQVAVVRVLEGEVAEARVDVVPGLHPVAAQQDLRRKWRAMKLGNTPEADAEAILGGGLAGVMRELLG